MQPSASTPFAHRSRPSDTSTPPSDSPHCFGQFASPKRSASRPDHFRTRATRSLSAPAPIQIEGTQPTRCFPKKALDSSPISSSPPPYTSRYVANSRFAEEYLHLLYAWI